MIGRGPRLTTLETYKCMRIAVVQLRRWWWICKHPNDQVI